MTQNPQTLIDSIYEYIGSNKKAARAGETISLDGLEVRIGELCGLVATLPKEEGAKFVPVLQEMMDELSDLGSELRRDRDSVYEQLQQLGLRKKATVAYGSVNAIDSAIAKPKDGE